MRKRRTLKGKALSANDRSNRIFADSFIIEEDMSVSEYADKFRYLSAENSYKHGKWKSYNFQKEVMDTMFHPDYQMVVLMFSAQSTKTEMMLNGIQYGIMRKKGGITFMLPSDTMAIDYSSGRVAPMIRDNPDLLQKVGNSKSSGNRVLMKNYAGGYLRFVGSSNADKLCSFPSPYIFVDELDRCKTIARNSDGKVEGNSLLILFERMKEMPNSFVVMASTPGLAGNSQIYDYFQKSDRRYPLTPCPHCKHEQFLDWENFSWSGKEPDGVEYSVAELLESFHFLCSHCKEPIYENDLPPFPLPVSRWEKRNPDMEQINEEGEKIAGFHMNAFYMTSWRKNFKKFLEARGEIMKHMAWFNTTLGLPFESEGLKTPSWEELNDRDKYYKRGEVYRDSRILIAGCDVQIDRIEFTIVGVYKRQFHVVDHITLAGNTSNMDDPMWETFHDLLYNGKWRHPDGYDLQIHRMAIDSRHARSSVWKFARTRKKLIPVTGTKSWDDIIFPAKKFEVKVNGRLHRLGKSRYPLGVNLLKCEVYSRLILEEKDGHLASEAIIFPKGLGTGYYRQLTGEVCEMIEGTDGRTALKWDKKFTNVEALDCMVYASALYYILNMNKWSDERWANLTYEREETKKPMAKAVSFL